MLAPGPAAFAAVGEALPTKWLRCANMAAAGEEQMNDNVQRARVWRRSPGGRGRLHGSTVRLGNSYGSK